MFAPRLTIRRLMFGVAIIAVGLAFAPWVAECVLGKTFGSIGLVLVLVAFAVALTRDIIDKEARERPQRSADRRDWIRFGCQILAAFAIVGTIGGSVIVGVSVREHWDRQNDWYEYSQSELGRYQTRRQRCLTYVDQLEAGRRQELELLRIARSEGDEEKVKALRCRITLREQAIQRFLQKADEEGREVGKYQFRVNYRWWTFSLD